MRRLVGVLGVVGVLAAGMPPPDADAAVVLCKRKKKLLLREDACKANEQAVTLSGAAVDPTGMPKVPSAAAADTAAQAASATSAATATTATSADSAADADMLGGLAPSAFQRRVRWALVASDGTIVTQSGGITVVSTAVTGIKVLDFGESQLGRAVIATLKGGPSADGMIRVTICNAGVAPETTTCNVAGAANTPNEIGVGTLDTTGTLANKSFYVAVLP